uniref:Uncharacterized protein n=1 Tax=Quercus lobata TaxID=97700 RepID=A0A7N2LNL8_QUELO
MWCGDRKLAAELVDPIQSGDFDQALMELGATRQDFSAVCVVELLGGQRTLEGSQIDSRKLLGGLEKLEGRQTNNRFLLVKRPDDGLLAGLWEFLSVLLDGEANLATRREVIDHFLKNNFGLDTKQTCDIDFRKNVGEFVHIFSRICLKIYVDCWCYI